MKKSENWMESTLKNTAMLYEGDEKKSAPKWRGRLKWILIVIVAAIVIQMVYAGILAVLAWRAEGTLTTARSYGQIEQSFQRVNEKQAKLVDRYQFYEKPFAGEQIEGINYDGSFGCQIYQSGGGMQSRSSAQEDQQILWQDVGAQDSRTNTEDAQEVEADQVVLQDGYLYTLHQVDGEYISAMDKGDVLYILKKQDGICKYVGKVRLDAIIDEVDESSIDEEQDGEATYNGLFVWQHTVIYLRSTDSDTYIVSVDITDPANPQVQKMITQTGKCNNARLYDGQLVVATSSRQTVSMFENEQYPNAPRISGNYLDAKDVYFQRDLYLPGFSTIADYELQDAGGIQVRGKKAVTGASDRIYMKDRQVYVFNPVMAKRRDKTQRTGITRLEIGKDGTITGKAHGIVEGTVGDGFAVKEQNGHLWLCMTVRHYTSEWKWKEVEVPFTWKMAQHYTAQMKMVCGEKESAKDISVYALDQDLAQVGIAQNVCDGEEVQYTRFFDDNLYLATDQKQLYQISMKREKTPSIVTHIPVADEIQYLHMLSGDDPLLIAVGKTTSGELDMTVYAAQQGKNIETVENIPLIQRASEALKDHTQILVQQTERGFYLGFATQNAMGQQYPLLHYTKGQPLKEVLRSDDKKRDDRWCRGLFVDGDFYVIRDASSNLQIEQYLKVQGDTKEEHAVIWKSNENS